MRQILALLNLLIISAAGLCQAANQLPAPTGRWEGVVEIPGSEMRFVVDLEQKDQQWVGSLVALDFGLKGVPLVGIAVKERDIEFGLKGSLGDPTFKAHLESDGTLKGEYMQGGNKAPFVLKRVAKAQVDPPEVSTPVSKDLRGEWKGDFQFLTKKVNVILKLPSSGTATTPNGELVFVEYGNASFPIGLWQEEGNKIYFTADNGGMTYEGEVHKNPSEIAGSFRKGSFEVPLTLRPVVTDTSTGIAVAAPNSK